MKKRYFLVSLIFLIFFAISFLTNIPGSINPNVSDSFKLTGTMTGLLPYDRQGMVVLYIPLIYVLIVSFKANPLIQNATIKSNINT